MTLHQHLDQLAVEFGEMLDEDIAALEVVIEGEVTTLGDLFTEEITSLEDENRAAHYTIIHMLMEIVNATGADEEFNITGILEEIHAVQTSIELISDVDEVINSIETMEISMEERDQDLQDSDDRIKLFSLIMVILLIVAIILMVLNIVFTKMSKKTEQEETK
jgi:DNA-directed RNA polymerase subunit L